MGFDEDGGSLGDAVWQRRGSSTISRQLFLLIMGGVTLYGLALTSVLAYSSTGWLQVIPAVSEGAKATYQWHGPINEWVFLIGVLVSGFAGIGIALTSEKPIISLIGFTMVAGPFGLLLGPTVGMYETVSVVKVIFVTAGVTGIFTFIGAAIPDSLESWGGWLFGGLSLLLFGSFGIPLASWFIPGFPIQGALTLMDWFGVIIFSGYIVFDMNRAMRVPATPDNAVDCSLAMYLNIINLFIRFLELMGKKKDE